MPAQPDEYCQHRIQTAINFFKDRIPLRYRIRSLCQSIIVAGSLAGVLLATWGLMVWAAIISITTGAVTAWLEFTGTNNKINRYSTTVAGLQNVLIWWNTRPAIEKSKRCKMKDNADYRMLVLLCYFSNTPLSVRLNQGEISLQALQLHFSVCKQVYLPLLGVWGTLGGNLASCSQYISILYRRFFV